MSGFSAYQHSLDEVLKTLVSSEVVTALSSHAVPPYRCSDIACGEQIRLRESDSRKKYSIVIVFQAYRQRTYKPPAGPLSGDKRACLSLGGRGIGQVGPPYRADKLSKSRRLVPARLALGEPPDLLVSGAKILFAGICRFWRR
ncbi:hypothetical protein NL676_035492 [Syzygium grande]|nr:hypothetical protein NL676_035492 [Syzygium grande]